MAGRLASTVRKRIANALFNLAFRIYPLGWCPSSISVRESDNRRCTIVIEDLTLEKRAYSFGGPGYLDFVRKNRFQDAMNLAYVPLKKGKTDVDDPVKEAR